MIFKGLVLCRPDLLPNEKPCKGIVHGLKQFIINPYHVRQCLANDFGILNDGDFGFDRGEPRGRKGDCLNNFFEQRFGDGFVFKIPNGPPRGNHIEKHVG